jgi:hypothetical protein
LSGDFRLLLKLFAKGVRNEELVRCALVREKISRLRTNRPVEVVGRGALERVCVLEVGCAGKTVGVLGVWIDSGTL